MELVKSIAEKISVETPDFSNCINVVKHDLNITGIETTVRFHYLKFDGNKQPMVKALLIPYIHTSSTIVYRQKIEMRL